jgi:hypothetical protein
MKFDGGRGIMGYGDDEDVERILQVLNSTHIRDYIIEKYDCTTIITSTRTKNTPKQSFLKPIRAISGLSPLPFWG